MPTEQANAADLVIRNAALLDGGGPVDVAVSGGMIAAVGPDLAVEAARTIDAAGGLVTTSFIDPHFHLDKVLSRGHFGAVSYQEGFGLPAAT